MRIATPAAPSGRFTQVTLWLATVLLALPVFAAGLPKLFGQGGWIRLFAHWGYPAWLVPIIGLGEMLGVALLLVPRFASAGAAMIAIVMAGAALTHATHHEAPRVVFTSILCGLALLIAWARLTRFRFPVASHAARHAPHSPARS
jgi:uncharacterized membrane protein YphA (DoxX/SURF4 family)